MGKVLHITMQWLGTIGWNCVGYDDKWRWDERQAVQEYAQTF